MPVPFTEEEATMIDLETPSQTDEHRKGPKRVLLAGLLAAAAVVVIALVAIRDDDPASPSRPTVPDRDRAPTLPPQALFGTPDEQLAPGTYFVDEVEGAPTPRIFVTLGDGWTNPATAGRSARTAPDHDVQPTRPSVLGRLPPERWIPPGASDYP